jgi:DNA-binding NarL/FixJ family response regulator
MSPLRLLLVDDNAEFLETLVGTLTSNFVVVGALANGESVLAHLAQLDPDIIILDISLPDINGFEIAKRLRKAGCFAKIVFMSNYEQREMVRAAFEIGAAGYVYKSRMVPDLIDAIKAVSQGDDLFWCSSSSLIPAPHRHR